MTLITFAATRSVAVLALVTAGAAAHAACPDRNLEGTILALTAAELRTPVSIEMPGAGGGTAAEVEAGRTVWLKECSSQIAGGEGFVTRRPDFTLQFSENSDSLALDVRVVSSCDMVLLVNTGFAENAWHFSDDADRTLNPRIIIDRASDRSYGIWVGTHDLTPCDATLVFSAH